MNKGAQLELEIIDLAFGGKGLGKVDGMVVFVDGALPGQTIRCRVTKKKKRFLEAKLLEVLKRSPDEIEIPHQEVPGAPWAKLPSEIQLRYKKEQVFSLFEKFAEIELEALLDEVIPSPVTWGYRNKMEFSFGAPGFSLGFKKRGQFYLVENLETSSGLFDEAFEKVLPEIRAWAEASGLPVYDQKANEGFWRHLVVRKSFFEDTFLVNVVTNSFGSIEGSPSIPPGRGEKIQQALVELLLEKFGDRIAGIFWSENADVSDTAAKYSSRTLLHGRETIMEKINDLEFEISLDSFFQTNPASAEILYKKVVQYLGTDSHETILDLFCGTGTIGQIVARHCPSAQVKGVEIVESAVEDAKRNATRNGIENIEFVCGDVRRVLKEWLEERSKSQKVEGTKSLGQAAESTTIVLDPPRSGMAPKALGRVLKFKAQHIIYVSCNPATMARDAKTMSEAGYKLETFSIVNQFPHTAHVECVGRWGRSN